jgi:hypothetical protein
LGRLAKDAIDRFTELSWCSTLSVRKSFNSLRAYPLRNRIKWQEYSFVSAGD